MKLKHLLFGERSLTKVAALFPTQGEAEHAAQDVTRAAALDGPQLYLVGPPDSAGVSSPAFSRKLEPEQAGIWRTLIRAHLVTGAVGLIIALLVYLGFLARDSAAITSAPGMSLAGILFFGAAIGLLVGGLLTARPDHSLVISAVRRAIRRGRWAVVVHPLTQRQLDVSLRELRNRSARVVRSL